MPQSAASEASNFQDNTKLAKLDNLKRKITWICCSDLLDPPLPYVGAVTYEKGDTEEDKRLKREDQARKLREKEEERIRREPELVEKFEKVIERVRKARSEYPKPEVDYLQNSIARTVTNFRCKICNNKVGELSA